MIRDVILRFLDREPQTLEQLAEETQIPRTIIRSSLIQEMYVQTKVNHIEIGEVTAWVPNPGSRVKISPNGVYSVIDGS